MYRRQGVWLSIEAALDVLELGRHDPLCLLGGLAPLYAPLCRRAIVPCWSRRRRCARRRGVDGGQVFRRQREEAEWPISPTRFSSCGQGNRPAGRATLSAAEKGHRGGGPVAASSAPGDALPSERDIAIKADISRVTVRKAVQDLVRGRHPRAAPWLRHLRRPAQGSRRAVAVTADLLYRGHGAAWHGGAIGMARPRHLCAVAR